MAENAGTIFANLEIRGNYATQLAAAATATKTFGEKAMKLGAQLQAAGAGISLAFSAPVALATKKIVKLGMDSVETDNLVRVAFGNMADNIFAWSKQVGNALNLNDVVLRDQAGKIFLMAKSMGIAEEAAYDMATGVVELSKDIASLRNLTFEEAFIKLQSGLVGEIEPLRKLGILVDVGTTKMAAYRHGIAETGEALTQQQKVLARYAAIVDQTNDDLGDLARTLQDPANLLRGLGEIAARAGTALGQAFEPQVRSILGALLALVLGLESLAQALKGTSGVFRNAIAVFAGLAIVSGPLLFAIGAFTIALGGLGIGIGTVLAALVGWAAVLTTVVSVTGLATDKFDKMAMSSHELKTQLEISARGASNTAHRLREMGKEGGVVKQLAENAKRGEKQIAAMADQTMTLADRIKLAGRWWKEFLGFGGDSSELSDLEDSLEFLEGRLKDINNFLKKQPFNKLVSAEQLSVLGQIVELENQIFELTKERIELTQTEVFNAENVKGAMGELAREMDKAAVAGQRLQPTFDALKEVWERIGEQKTVNDLIRRFGEDGERLAQILKDLGQDLSNKLSPRLVALAQELMRLEDAGDGALAMFEALEKFRLEGARGFTPIEFTASELDKPWTEFENRMKEAYETWVEEQERANKAIVAGHEETTTALEKRQENANRIMASGWGVMIDFMVDALDRLLKGAELTWEMAFQALGAAAGAALGSMVGMPQVGAAIGGALGGAIGAWIDGVKTVAEIAGGIAKGPEGSRLLQAYRALADDFKELSFITGNLSARTLPGIRIKVKENGETYAAIWGPNGAIQKSFKTFDEAMRWVTQQAIRLANFTDEAAIILRNATINDNTLDEAIEVLTTIQELGDLQFADTTQELRNLIREFDRLEEQFNRYGASTMHLVDGFQAQAQNIRDQILGIVEDPIDGLIRRAKEWNRELQAQIAIEKARIATLRAQIQSLGAGIHATGIAIEFENELTLARGRGAQASMAAAEAELLAAEASLDAAEALLISQSDLEAAIRRLRRAGRGGRGEDDTSAADEAAEALERLFESIEDLEFEASLRRLTDLDAAIARVNRKFDEMLVDANGNAEAIRRINRLRRREIRWIREQERAAREAAEAANQVQATHDELVRTYFSVANGLADVIEDQQFSIRLAKLEAQLQVYNWRQQIEFLRAQGFLVDSLADELLAFVDIAEQKLIEAAENIGKELDDLNDDISGSLGRGSIDTFAQDRFALLQRLEEFNRLGLGPFAQEILNLRDEFATLRQEARRLGVSTSLVDDAMEKMEEDIRRRAREPIDNLLRDLLFTGPGEGTPFAQLMAAQAEFDELIAAGDVDSGARLAELGQKILELADQVFSSGADFQAIRAAVVAALQAFSPDIDLTGGTATPRFEDDVIGRLDRVADTLDQIEENQRVTVSAGSREVRSAVDNLNDNLGRVTISNEDEWTLGDGRIIRRNDGGMKSAIDALAAEVKDLRLSRETR